MEIKPSVARGISRFAWVMAAVGTVVGQVHALARAQAHPGDFEESPLARAWGEPAIRALRPLLDWSDPVDRVRHVRQDLGYRSAWRSPSRRTWSTGDAVRRPSSDACSRSRWPRTPR